MGPVDSRQFSTTVLDSHRPASRRRATARIGESQPPAGSARGVKAKGGSARRGGWGDAALAAMPLLPNTPGQLGEERQTKPEREQRQRQSVCVRASVWRRQNRSPPAQAGAGAATLSLGSIQRQRETGCLVRSQRSGYPTSKSARESGSEVERESGSEKVRHICPGPCGRIHTLACR